MRKTISVLLIIALTAFITSCAVATSGDRKESTDAAAILAGEISGEITVYYYDSLLYEGFLTEAAKLFEHGHPGTKINIKGFSIKPEIKTMDMDDGSVVSVADTGDDSQAKADYISLVNTELMSGKGPDVLAVDVLPYYKYAESGLFEDMQLFMDADKDFVSTDYRFNIIDSMKYKEGQYMMPLDFGFNFISFNKNRVDDTTANALRDKSKFTYWELTDMIAGQFSNDNSGARVIDFQEGAIRVFRSQFYLNYGDYVDLPNKKANFTDGGFVQLIKKIDEQRKNGYFVPEFSSVEEQTQDFIDGQDLYYYNIEIDSVLAYIFSPTYQSESFPAPDADEIVGLLTNDEGESEIKCYQSYGMNSNSGNKKLAWEFIKFMLSEEMQSSLNLIGFPINNDAFIEESKSSFSSEYPEDGKWVVTGEENINAYNNYMEYLNGFVNELSLYPVTDKIINDVVLKEMTMFFEGSVSAEEVADTLQNRIQLYLSE